MSEGCKIILAGKIKMLKTTQTCMHKRVHTQEYIFLHPHTHNVKHKHNWIFFSYTTFTLKLTRLWGIFWRGSTILCSVFRPSCIASGRKFLPPVCFFFLPFHFVDVIITYLSAPENYKVNNCQATVSSWNIWPSLASAACPPLPGPACRCMTPDRHPSISRSASSAGLDNTIWDAKRVLETFGGFAEWLDIHLQSS